MRTRRQKAIQRLRYYGQFLPFTFRAFWLILGGVLFYQILWPRIPDRQEWTPDQDLLWLMIQMAAGFALCLAFISIGSVMICWLYYRYHRKKGHRIWTLHPQEEGEKKGTPASLTLHRYCRPFLGAIKVRWVYDRFQLSPRFTLSSLLKSPYGGRNRGRRAELPALDWPDIREYPLDSAIIQVQDLFRMVSLPVKVDFRQSYIPPPPPGPFPASHPSPRIQQESEHRIPWLRKSTGDFIQHKDFEAGDDIRRIAWKWYARNRELLVRIPEIQEPYASELYVYASFFDDPVFSFLPEDYRLEMLNFYKTRIWATIQGIRDHHPATHFIADQVLDSRAGQQETPGDWALITQAQWQLSTPPSAFLDLKKASLILVSSLTRPQDFEEIIEKMDRSQKLLVIPLSATFPKAGPWARLWSLFFRPPRDRWSRLNARWWYSPWRARLKKREKQWEQLLESYGRESVQESE